jgi:hypothetical protein
MGEVYLIDISSLRKGNSDNYRFQLGLLGTAEYLADLLSCPPAGGQK